MVLSALRYMDEIRHMYEQLSKRGKFYFGSLLIVSHLNTDRERQVPTRLNLSFTQFCRFSLQIAEQ